MLAAVPRKDYDDRRRRQAQGRAKAKAEGAFDVRYVPDSGAKADIADGPRRAIGGLAPYGTSARIDEIRKLIEAGILRAVSVGFRPLETRPRSESQFGSFYTKAELVETSLVSVPANPNALSVAKQLRISDDTMKLVFAEPGRRNEPLTRRRLTGERALTGRRIPRPASRMKRRCASA
jgi:hypothetical protein